MLRLLWASLLSRRGESLALVLLIILAVGSATATPLYMDTAGKRAVAAELDAATAAERSYTVQAPVAGGGIAGMAESLRQRLRAAMPYPGLTEVTGGWIGGAAVSPGNPAYDTRLVAREGFCQHLRLDGACPASRGEVVVSKTMASALGLKPGDTIGYRIFAMERDVPLKVTGVYGEIEAVGDPFWAGRSVLTPYPNRGANPIFTLAETIVESGVDTSTAYVDLVAEDGALDEGNIRELAGQLQTTVSFPIAVEAASGLQYLVARVSATKWVLTTTLPSGALQLLLLCWLVLVLTITYGAVHRRAESGVSSLRGAPFRARLMISFAPTALILLIFSPIGFAAGILAAQAMPTMIAIVAAAAALVAVLITAAIATWRVNAISLYESLRDVPSRRGSKAALAAEVAAVAFAVMAVIEALSNSDTVSIGLLAPVSVALVVGLVAARLVRAVAGAAGAATLRRGRLALGLAALQLARRPGADRLVALIVIAVALSGHAFAAWQAAATQTRQRAEVELGANRVITVAQTTRPQLLSAVRRADPEGKWAMAAALGGGSTSELVAVDTSRLVRVTESPALEQYVSRLRPPAADPVRVNGSGLSLTFESNNRFTRRVDITVMLTGPEGEPVSGTFTLSPSLAERSGRVEVPACAKGEGCRLSWIRFSLSPDGLFLKSIVQERPERTVLSGAAMGSPTRWRREFDYEAAVRMSVTQDSVSISYVGQTRFETPAVKLIAADNPIPLPALAVGEAGLKESRELPDHEVFSTRRRPVELLAVMPALPGIFSRGVLMDLDLADALSDTLDNDAELQVWLGKEAPPDAESRLRQVGLLPLRSETVAERASSLDARGAGPGARLQLAAAIIGILLLVPAIAVVASADRRSRAIELQALRVQGVPETVVRRATGGYGLLVAAAFPVGMLTSLLTWRLTLFGSTAPSQLAMLAAFTGAAVILGSAAWLARLRLATAVRRLTGPAASRPAAELVPAELVPAELVPAEPARAEPVPADPEPAERATGEGR